KYDKGKWKNYYIFYAVENPLNLKRIRRNYTYKQRESKSLDLSKTTLKGVELIGAHLEKANLSDAHLEKANLSEAHLEKANLTGTHLEGALLGVTHLEETYLIGAYFEGVKFVFACLKGADLRVADLRGAFGLSPGELSKVKTLYKAELDDELRLPLEQEYPTLFNEPDLGMF
ncbi:pentapeptide repeat-containing protein, partial [Methanosarcina spelaei]|uniref:pentapeptide repeat-containing protein n=1 Tax=Methanosarcina spelaei TaxID=1036679 RepID=UPI001140C996